jgi:hypothetical protein
MKKYSQLSVPHTQDFDDSDWEKISLPHDWGMRLGYSKEQLKVKGYRTLGGRSPENSVGWYRKNLKIDAVKGCRYTLEFEGIFRDAQVWMNGIYLGHGTSGYPSSQEPDQFPTGNKAFRNAFGGLAQLIVRSDRSGSSIVLIAKSVGLLEDTLTINVK